MTVLLKADHVTKKFGGLTAVNRVDFEIETGMIAGLIEKCVDHAPMAQVLAHYRYHVAWHDDAHPGGREAGNEQVLADFDCALITAPAAGAN